MPKKKKRPARFDFKPFSEQQRRLIHWWRPMAMSSENDIVIADGAIRSGKTIAMIIGFLTWSQEMFSGQSFILAGKTMGALKKNVVRPMLQMLEAWGWPYEYVRSGTDARIEIGTNTYYLYGASTEASQDALQGLTAAGAYADEAALFPQNFIDQMMKSADRCTSDVHTGSFSDRFQTFQYLDLICSVFCTHPYPPKFLFKNQFFLRSPEILCQSKNYSRSVHPDRYM